MNIVVVDDDPAITRLVAAYLATEGSSTNLSLFNDSFAAQRWLDKFGCDLLLSDIEMPGLDGLAMLRFAKLRNAWTQVVFMTAHSTWEHVNKAIEHGAADYLLKPIDRPELLQVVRQERQRIDRWLVAAVNNIRSLTATGASA